LSRIKPLFFIEMPIVYIATNVMNGKFYIGASKNSIDTRRRQHCCKLDPSLKGCPILSAAIRKYGKDAFLWEVLSQHPDMDSAFAAEKSAIKLFRPQYNIAAGGPGTPGTVQKERIGSQRIWNKRSVLCLEDGLVFNSLTAAAKYYRIDLSTLSQVCKYGKGTVGGRHFIYSSHPLDEVCRKDLIFKSDLEAIKRRRRGGQKQFRVIDGGLDRLGRSAAGPMSNARTVVCVTTGKTFPSASAAASHYEVPKSAVIELCLGKNNRKTVSGLVFKYYMGKAA
jgi:predicted GIY-YIG superfamily endonuclease